MNTRGQHYLLDVWDFDLKIKGKEIAEILRAIAISKGATVLKMMYHDFEPYGSTVILLLGESHISIHTFPEEKYAAIDVYTCGKVDANEILKDIVDTFAVDKDKAMVCEVERGNKKRR